MPGFVVDVLSRRIAESTAKHAAGAQSCSRRETYMQASGARRRQLRTALNAAGIHDAHLRIRPQPHASFASHKFRQLASAATSWRCWAHPAPPREWLEPSRSFSNELSHRAFRKCRCEFFLRECWFERSLSAMSSLSVILAEDDPASRAASLWSIVGPLLALLGVLVVIVIAGFAIMGGLSWVLDKGGGWIFVVGLIAGIASLVFAFIFASEPLGIFGIIATAVCLFVVVPR